MTKSFRSNDIDQALLMPPSLQDWLPENHLARFVAELAVSLDLSAIYLFYEQRDGRGQAAYHPVMMVRLLMYGYCIGLTSSRKIEKRTYDDVAFRYLSAGEHPDHNTLNEFRNRARTFDRGGHVVPRFSTLLASPSKVLKADGWSVPSSENVARLPR